jgi:eukaryotic-like serine/threonine-protein kinase
MRGVVVFVAARPRSPGVARVTVDEAGENRRSALPEGPLRSGRRGNVDRVRFVRREGGLQPDAPRPSGPPASGLPVELERIVASRLAVVALASATVWAITLAIGYPLFTLMDLPRPLYAQFSEFLRAAMIGLSLVVYWAARRQRLSADSLINLGLAFEVLMALTIAVLENLITYSPGEIERGISWVGLLIVFFPLIVPAPTTKTLVASLLAGCTPALVLATLDAADLSHPSWHVYLALGIANAIAVGLALVLARVHFRLNQSVRQARELGAYVLETSLGQGGMGEVWLGRHRLLARPAAIKLIRPEILVGPQPSRGLRLHQRFEREAQATAALRSPHTIQLFDFGVAEDGAFYYVMELLDGIDLDTLVKRFGPLLPARVTYLLDQICHSLEEAHQAGLIHRDIKPANLFLCRQTIDYDVMKVLDFGLVKDVARGSSRPPSLTDEGLAVGTPAFMAPELVLHRGSIDGRVDLYALGCVAYWLLTGQPVFDGESAVTIALQHVQAKPVPPSELAEQAIPPELEALVMRCLRKDPAERWQSAGELSSALRALPFHGDWTNARAKAWWELHLGKEADPAWPLPESILELAPTQPE